jgi:hypothetical protein
MKFFSRPKLRTRNIGSNILSDKYTIPIMIEDRFQDLALFIGHTGFANVRQKNNTVDADIIPIFRCMGDVYHFLRHRPPSNEITCGLAFQSLDMAWQIVQQNMIAEGNTLWYILDDLCFILYIQSDISKSTLNVLTDDDIDPVLNSMRTTFRPDKIEMSIDSFVVTQIIHHIQKSTTTTLNIPMKQLSSDDVYTMTKTMLSSVYIHTALCIMYPRYMKIHRLSRHSIANRLAKYRCIEI